MVGAGPQLPLITGHIVLVPAATPHRPLRLVQDVDLLLAATIASVRMYRPVIVFEPPAAVASCGRCQQTYAEARRSMRRPAGLRSEWSGW
jgi:hypothetical protein